MILTIIVFLLTLGVLVISHELGHFLVAKKFDIKVLEFGFGLPPRAWKKKVGETIVSLNWLPIGGFVRLLGEDEVDPKLREDKRSFANKPVIQRLAVVLAGVTVNLIFAWILFYGLLLTNDFKIFYPFVQPSTVVTELEKGYPAENSGLKVGEKVVGVDNQQFNSVEDLISYIRNKPDTQIQLQVTDQNGQNQHNVPITPKNENSVGKIGVAFNTSPFKRYYSFTDRLFSGITYSFDLIKYTLAGLGTLGSNLYSRQFTQVSQSVAGPVGLAVMTNDILSNGWDAIGLYIWFVAVISLTLSVMNALPFPALDGGRAVFLLYELILRRKPNPDFERWVHTVGMAILFLAMIAITYSDISKLHLF